MDFLNIFLNFILPILIAVGFISFLIFQIFNKSKSKAKKYDKNVLYSAHSSNKGVPADEVFEMLRNNSIKLNYLGYKKDA